MQVTIASTRHDLQLNTGEIYATLRSMLNFHDANPNTDNNNHWLSAAFGSG
jgi:hypothetical protein